MVTFAAGRTV